MVLNCFSKASHLIRIICDHFVDDNERFDFVAHWNSATGDDERHCAVGGYDNLDSGCIRVQHVHVQSEIDVGLVQMIFEKRVDKRDKI